jgi:DNA-binding response OmpR family regulator
MLSTEPYEAKIADLEYQVEELREALCDCAQIPGHKQLGITRSQHRVLVMLLKHQQVTRRAMFTALYGIRPEADQPNIEAKIFDVFVMRLRQWLPPGATIETMWGQGWRMSYASKMAVMARIGGLSVVDYADFD